MAVVILVTVGFAVPLATDLLDDEPDTLIRADTWEQLPRPPANDVLRGPEVGSAVWTGKELILLAHSPYDPTLAEEAARRACVQPGDWALAGAFGPARPAR